MIAATELRKGNYLKHGHSIEKVQAILWDDFISCDPLSADRELNEFEPILLTPEILKQCGFKQNRIHHSEYLIKTKIGNNSFMVKLGYKFKHEYNWWPEVKYLHQLQNLYHALTGEELEIKLPTPA